LSAERAARVKGESKTERRGLGLNRPRDVGVSVSKVRVMRYIGRDAPGRGSGRTLVESTNKEENMKMTISTVLALALVLSAALVMIGPLSTPVAALVPTEVWVCESTGSDGNSGIETEPFKTIQRGIDVVAEVGTVHVKPGVYGGHVTIEKSLTLKSTGGKGVTTITGLVTISLSGVKTVVFGEEDAGFTVDRTPSNPVDQSAILLSVGNSAEVTISHNTITGEDAGIRSLAGAIQGGGTVTIEHNVITGCPGHGVYLYDISYGTVTIESNEITGNGAAGVYIDKIDQGPETVTIAGNIITGNSGRGISVGSVSGSALIIEDNDVQDNGQRGIFIFGVSTVSTVDIRGNTIGGDTEGDGNGQAGIYIGWINDSDVTIGGDTENDGNIISHNGKGVPSTGIHIDYITNSDVIIEHNTITDNQGPGIYIDIIGRAIMTVTIARNSITDNTLSGIRVREVFESTLVIEENTIMDNGGLQDPNVLINSIYDSEVAIEANTISDGRDGRGVRLDHVGHAPRTVSIIWNSITGTDLGISVGEIFDSALNILGNVIDDNRIGVSIGGVVDSMPRINFNNIFGNADWGLRNSSATVVDATHNWWGAADGPSQSPGSGDRVSENVDFAPWLGAAITDQRTGCTTDRGYGVDAGAETDNLSATSTGGNQDTTVTLAEYADNPTDLDPGFAINNVFFFDVHVGGPPPYPDELVVEVNCPTGNCAGVVLKWFNGTEWLPVVAPTSVVNGRVQVVLSDTSNPTVEQLTGSPFGLGGDPVPPPQPPTAGLPYPIWAVLLAGLMAGGALLALRRRQTQS